MSYLEAVKTKRDTEALNSDKEASLRAFNTLASEIRTLLSSLEKTGAKRLDKDFVSAVKSLEKVAGSIEDVKITNDRGIQDALDTLSIVLRTLDVKPVVNVPQAKVEVNEREIDFKPLITALQKLEAKAPQVNVDTSDVKESVDKVHKAIKSLSFPVSNYILPFKDSSGKAVQALVDDEGFLQIVGSKGSTSTTTQVGDSASVVTLKAANTSRVKLVIVNTSTAVLYVKEGSTATTSDWTYRLEQYDGSIIDDYTGIVTGIWDSDAGGGANVTETV